MRFVVSHPFRKRRGKDGARSIVAGTAAGACAYPVAGAELRREAPINMVKFLLWCILLVFCWPLALVALVLYPVVWLLLFPFRVVGIAVGGALELVGAVIFLPVRLLRGI